MNKPFEKISYQTDEWLLAQLYGGSEEAFSIIYERYHKLIYTLAFSYLKSAFMAEDTVQFVFLKLWESREILTVRLNLRNYLYTMAKNQILNEIRNNNVAVQKNYEIAQYSPEYENELLARLEEKEMMDLFYQAIHRLPEQKKQVCLLKLQGDLSNQEIADMMRISVPTVKTHYAQAIKMLRAYFDKLLILLFFLFLK